MTSWATPAPAPPPAPPPPRRGRRKGLIALAVVAVLGTAIGLLVAQPWAPPPLLAPLGVRAVAQSTTSATVSWRQAPGSRVPDSWVVFRDKKQYATVPAKASSFTDGKVEPGDTHVYRVAEASGTGRSLQSATASVTTKAPAVRNLRQSAKNWSTVTLRWDPPSGAPAPDKYVISAGEDGTLGTVAGNVTTYTVSGLDVGSGTATYSVAALWSGNKSDTQPSVDAQPRQPPLNSQFQVNYHTAVSPGGDLKSGTNFSDAWTFSPKCGGKSCNEGLNADFEPPGSDIENTPFSMTLKPSGGHYKGTGKAQIFACGDRMFGETTDTVSVDIAPGHSADGAWTTFKGTVLVTMPYTNDAFDANMFCPNQTWTFDVSGSG